VPCPEGFQNDAGDDPRGESTRCVAISGADSSLSALGRFDGDAESSSLSADAAALSAQDTSLGLAPRATRVAATRTSFESTNRSTLLAALIAVLAVGAVLYGAHRRCATPPRAPPKTPLSAEGVAVSLITADTSVNAYGATV